MGKVLNEKWRVWVKLSCMVTSQSSLCQGRENAKEEFHRQEMKIGFSFQILVAPSDYK